MEEPGRLWSLGPQRNGQDGDFTFFGRRLEIFNVKAGIPGNPALGKYDELEPEEYWVNRPLSKFPADFSPQTTLL